MHGPILPHSFYTQPTVALAQALLGKELCHGPTSGLIVETEAYLGGDDLASHSARGITPRTQVIFGPPGRAYVYLIYGMYECLNITAEREGEAGCVLIRALEPLEGIDVMKLRRPSARKDRDLASGPGKLTKALGIGRELNGVDLSSGPLTIHDVAKTNFAVVVTPRIGITQCADWPLRFFIQDSPFVSKAT